MISEGNFLNAINKDGQQVMAKAQKAIGHESCKNKKRKKYETN